ncbi:MAG TPA: heme-binding protein [Caulobacteraceae bacterium]|nr:heme-binding protein [Caulobacteraceae bacterium]
MQSSSFIAVGALALMASFSAHAQDGADTAPPPQSMPGEYFDIPQSAQLKVPLGPPAGPNTNPRRPASQTVPSLGFALAVEAAQAAVQSCAADGYTVAAAVTDSAGNLKAALAPDGLRANGVYMAMHKAVTVVGFGMSTLQLRAQIERDPTLMARIKPNMSLLPGGLPIFKGGQLVGAIATSGAAAYEEEKCAQDGVRKIQSRIG